ncbi:BTB/POZ domain-containing protein At2g46260-like [Typha angustifolia]|uniref:BTB/POZ domain-containing protein At2g46260-like n=1 Tax=Typha angustifolia TaxID=59011 RepID=UPI003C2EB440
MNSTTVIAQKWYRINSIILMATSQYFRKCFESSYEQEEKVLTLHLKESEEPAFRKLLEFMHATSSTLATNPFKLSSAMMVAKQFEQQFWVKKCKEGLINRFKPLQHPELMSLLSLAAVIEILRSDDLDVQSEDDVYDFTLEWALRNYPSKQRRREVLEAELGPLIRFHYMSYKKLVQAVTNYYEYFSREFILKAAMTAVVAKQVSPDSHFVERAYKHKPLMVSEEFQPSRFCTIFLTFTRDECLKLIQSSPIRSMDFEFHDGEFFIQVLNKLKEERHIITYLNP